MRDAEACPLCGYNIPKGHAETCAYPVKISTAETPREIRFCPECGLGSAFPMPTEDALERMYHNMEYWELSDDEIPPRKEPVPYALARVRWRSIRSSIPNDHSHRGLRVLDIGAGHGYLGDVAASDRKSVLTAYAMVEPDDRMRRAVNSRWGQYGYRGDLELHERLSDVTGRYDLVVLSHVLEHVPDPVSFMKEALSHVVSGGYVFIDVPNQDYLFKEEVFPHLLFFSMGSMKKLLARFTLDPIGIDTWGRSMESSPVNAHPPFLVRVRKLIVNKLINRIPFVLSIPLVAGHYGFRSRNQNGTWIRALARKT